MWKKWQLFHATDFQSLMYPCFVFSRILGIFPYKINASTFEISRQRYILMIFLLCAFCICESLTIYNVINNKVKFGDDVIRNLQATCYYTFGDFIAIVTYALSGPRMRVLQAILEISSRLPPKLYRKLSRWIHIKDILGTSFVVTQECIYAFRNPKDFEFHILALYIGLLVFEMDMQYMNCVCVLKACFKRINDNLMHMQNVMVDNELNAPRLICDTQKNQFLFIKLKALKKQHLMVSNAMQTLNVVFSFQLLATITLTFTEITFETYFHIIQWQDGLSISLNSMVKDIFFLTSIAYSLIKLLLIVWACETAKNQAYEIKTIVHDVNNCISDVQIKEELQLFSLQILHCARNTFSTKGLSVDATLLAAMAGSITTYIIILVQFLIMAHSCDK